jgi:hypothetical protein
MKNRRTKATSPIKHAAKDKPTSLYPEEQGTGTASAHSIDAPHLRAHTQSQKSGQTCGVEEEPVRVSKVSSLLHKISVLCCLYILW